VPELRGDEAPWHAANLGANTRLGGRLSKGKLTP